MTTYAHPVTGVMINRIVTNSGPISDAERRTAHLLLEEGHPRWVVAAMLGRFPLAFDGTGRKPQRTRAIKGGDLPLRDARHDTRQMSMDDFWQDLFGRDSDGDAN